MDADSVFTDGTNQDEQSLIPLNITYKKIFDISPEAIILLDAKGIVCEVNKRVTDWLSYSRTEVIGLNIKDLPFLTDQSKNQALKMLSKRLAGETIPPYELEFLAKHGEQVIGQVRGNLLYDSAGTIVYDLVMISDITKEKQMEIQTKKAVERLQEIEFIINHSRSIAFLWKAETGWPVEFVTQNISIFGYTADDFISGRIAYEQLIHPDDLQHVGEEVQRYSQQGVNDFSQEYRIVTKNGEVRWIEDRTWIRRDVSGYITHYQGIIVDITQRKNFEKKLLDQEQQLRGIFDNIHLGISVISPHMEIVTLNRQMNKWFPTAKEGEHQLCYSVFNQPPRDQICSYCPTCKTLQDGLIHENVTETPTPNGIRNYRIVASPIKDEKGNIIAAIEMVDDITERKKTEEVLKIFKESLDNATDAIGMSTAQGRHYYQNKAFDQLFGAIGEKPVDAIYVNKNVGEEIFRTIMSGKQWTGEVQMYARDGKIKDIFLKAYPNRNNEGNITSLVGIHTDITERKTAEKALKESEEKYKRLFESSPDLILESDEEGHILAINPMMVKSIGIPLEKAIGINIFDILPREIAEQRAKIGRKALEEMKNQEFEDERMGRNFHSIYVPIVHSDGKKTIQLIVRDITEQKRAEKNSIESKEKLRSVIESSPDNITVSDLNGTIISCNQAAVDMHGFSKKEDMIGKNSLELISPKDREKALQNLKHILEVGLLKNVEYVCLKKDGNEFPIELSARIILDSSGKPMSLVAVIKDISERKKAEQLLKESEEKFRDLFENASDLIQSVDINGRFIYVNKKWLRTLGYTEDEAKNLTFTEILRKDQIPHCMEIIKEIYCGKSFDNIETVYVSKDGREIYVRGNANARFEDGKFVATRSIFRDVTEAKIAKDALIESEEKYRGLYESSQDAIMTLAPPYWLFTSGNPATIKLFNAKNEQEFMTKGPYDVSLEFQPDGRPSNEKALEMINLALKNGSNFFEWAHKRLTGEEFFATVLLTKMTLHGKEIIQATVRDITEHKKIEKQFIESQQKMTTITEAAKDGIIMLDRDGQVSFWNHAAEQIFGYTFQELKGQKLHDILAPVRFHSAYKKGFEKFQKTGGGSAVGSSLELVGKRKDGTEFPLELSLSSVKIQGEWNAVGIVRDITDRKHDEIQLKEKIEELERFKEITVDRELKMIELKNELKELKEKQSGGKTY